MTTDPYMDSLDEQLRAANKALEGQVPDRYFDLLPNRILARLEDPTMQSDVNRPRTTQPGANPAVPTVAGQRAETTDKVERKEDSGLNDIKAMAQTTKQRISLRRISAQRPATSPEDDDVLATSSSNLRAVALPIAARPSQPEIVGTGTGSARAVTDAPAPLLADPPTTSASASRPAMTATPIRPLPKKSKAPIVAVGAAVAAMAAGVVGYVVLQNQDDGAGAAKSNAGAPMSRQLEVTPLDKKTDEQPAAAMPATPPAAAFEATGAAAIAGPDTTAAAAAGGSGSVADDDAKAKAEKSDGESDRSRGRKDRDKDKGRDKDRADEKDVKKPEPTKGTSSTTPAPGPADKQDQTLDDLLRGAGVDPDASKKQQAPKLDKKELTATDIRNAMSALNGKAQACYAKHGVSGSVPVKLTVAASGEVKKAVVTGSFAGTPTGDCVQKAASGAKFPAWDGATMTVNYSYFLSE